MTDVRYRSVQVDGVEVFLTCPWKVESSSEGRRIVPWATAAIGRYIDCF